MGYWWEGVDESRLLIAPDPGANADASARLLSLRHPKSGLKTSYLLCNGSLQELHWFKQSYGSWFLGDYVSEDGSLYTATPIDPVFIMLPIFEEARMKKMDDPGKFRQLDEILFISDYPGYQHLFSMAENCMQIVCEIKEIGSMKFYRLDDMKVLAWLYHKVCQLKQTLPALDQNYAARDDKDTLADAISILGEYLKDEPWLKLLSNHFKLDLLEATRVASDYEVFPTSIESPIASSNLPKGKNTSEKRTGRNQKQAKKAKVETESRNIKEMFTRASRRN
ncbi:Ribonuclease H2, subunit B [Corchorus capsularis]|uniref:Ribonuclease H2 subunit B n=1 Tax=Corchorus capsularis TaxID=210143 RepID=A0A1R3J3B3_COCAP|nr:Ribonuclease H2, subunit B [Corchorus capsularis]